MCSAPQNTHILMAQTPLKQEFYYIPKDNLFPVAKTTLQSAKPLKGLKSSSFILPHFSFVLHHPSSFFIQPSFIFHFSTFKLFSLLGHPVERLDGPLAKMNVREGIKKQAKNA